MSPSFHPVHFQPGSILQETFFARAAITGLFTIKAARSITGLSINRASVSRPAKLAAIPATGGQQDGPEVSGVQINFVYFQRTSTNIKSGDRLLLVGMQHGATQTAAFAVSNVVPDSTINSTLVEFDSNAPTIPGFAPGSFPSTDLKVQNVPFNQDSVATYILSKTITEGDLQAFLKINGWNAEALETLVNNPPPPQPSPEGVFSFRGNSCLFWQQCAALGYSACHNLHACEWLESRSLHAQLGRCQQCAPDHILD